MQLGWDEHFREIVVPAWQAYLAAEDELTLAHTAKDPERIRKAKYRALREGGSATVYLSHYADIVAHERPDLLPDGVGDLPSVRKWVADSCKMLRTDQPVDDVALLGAVCDALKHSELTRNPEKRDVSAKDAVLVVETGYGKWATAKAGLGALNRW